MVTLIRLCLQCNVVVSGARQFNEQEATNWDPTPSEGLDNDLARFMVPLALGDTFYTAAEEG